MSRTRIVASVVLVIWSLAWVGMGIAVAREVRDLASLSDTVVSLGEATRSAGTALQGLEGLPVVGAELQEPAEIVRRAGERAVASGRESRSSAERLGTLLGISIAVVPTVAGLALFVATGRRP